MWNDETMKAFLDLKDTMFNTPVLAMPDFTYTFFLECDAPSSGIGAILMQEG